MKELRHFSHRLYIKLLAIYGITFFAVLLAMIIAFKMCLSDHSERYAADNINNYANYLARDIGNPPNLEKAKEISAKTKLEIGIVGSSTQWYSSDWAKKDIENFDELKRSRNAAPWKRKKIFFAKVGDLTFVFSARHFKLEEDIWWAVIFCILAEIAVFFISYKLIRRIFKPLDEMKSTIVAFGEGKWETRINSGCSKDFLELANTLNTMADKIETHFKNMKDLLLAVSHELRSPLARMKVALEFVEDQKIKESINEEIDSLDKMTGMLLERERLSSRPELLLKNSYSLKDIFASFEKKYEIVVDITSNKNVSVDLARFNLALNNIIDNAFKHGKPPVNIWTEETTGGVELFIQDAGKGMSEEQLKSLGTPFYRENKARTCQRYSGGYGLGLSLAVSIIRAHGFAIQARNSSEGGAIFIISMIES